MKQFVTGYLLWLTTSMLYAADQIEGYWKVIDDRTGFASAVIDIRQDDQQRFYGKIVRLIPRPDYQIPEYCQNCPKPFTNQPILGMVVLWNAKVADQQSRWSYDDGFAIDALTGKIYRGRARLSQDQRKLTIRGHLEGATILGRAQTWIRVSSPDDVKSAGE